MDLFNENGAGKRPGSLRFAFEFTVSLSHDDTTKIAQQSDFLTPGEILKHNGRSLQEFKSIEAAMEDVEYIVKKNQEEFGWTDAEYPPRHDAEKPAYSKFFYVKSKGKEESWQQTQHKKLDGTATLSNGKQLENALPFMEGFGFKQESAVQLASVEGEKLTKELESLSSAYLLN